jgi:hypothetical protein
MNLINNFYKKIIIIQQYFFSNNKERQEEINNVLKLNIENKFIDEIYLLNEEIYDLEILKNQKIKQIKIGKRITYKLAFEFGNLFPNNYIKIFCNNDIFFDEEIHILKTFNLNNKCLALTRYDIISLKPFKYKLMECLINNLSCSQDTWIFNIIPIVNEMNFYQGINGCDNRIVYILKNIGIDVINNCHTVKTFHLHLINSRTYGTTNSDTIIPSYINYNEIFLKMDDWPFNKKIENSIERNIENSINIPPYFNWQYYIDTYDDLKNSGINSFEKAKEHWILHGYKEKRNCQFSAEFYILKYDLKKININNDIDAFKHWQKYGKYEKKYPCLNFKFYLDVNDDLKNLNISDEYQLMKHWISHGKNENRIHEFDWMYYLSVNPDLIYKNIDNEEKAIFHWINFGKYEARNICRDQNINNFLKNKYYNIFSISDNVTLLNYNIENIFKLLFSSNKNNNLDKYLNKLSMIKKDDIITSDKFLNNFPEHYYKLDVIINKKKIIWRGKEKYPPSKYLKIIISGHSDYSISDETYNYYKPTYWFTINKITNNVFSIPLGITNYCNDSEIHKIYGDLDSMIEVMNETKNDKNLVFMNFNISTYPTERQHVYNLFCDKLWVSKTEIVNTIEGRKKFLREIRNHTFVLCPRGNGIDTHRLWETLYMGSIPIIKRNIAYEDFYDLPICLVNEWEEINQEFLLREKNRILNGVLNIEKLFMNFWIEKINNYCN